MRSISPFHLVWIVPFALIVYALVEIAEQDKAALAEKYK